jgi:hypothetical protein
VKIVGVEKPGHDFGISQFDWAQCPINLRGVRTSEWRNQKLLDYPMTSTRIWKKWSKQAPAISIAWLPFPNENSS